MKTALISGATSGIGRAAMSRFSREGWHVIGLGRDEQRLKEVEKESLDSGAAKVTIISIDLGELEQLKSIGSLLSNIGSLDALVNCAGLAYESVIENTSIDQWEEVMRVNVSSIFFLTQQLIPLLERSDNASIVNVSSIAGRLRSISLGCHYTVSKAALIGMTRHLAAELAPKGIRVNCTAPSQTHSPMLEAALSKENQVALAKHVPLGRLAEAYEQADVIYYLCSSQSSYINGAILDVNGGLL